MIWLDVTKSGRARHRSGLMRVTERLRQELGAAATPVAWDGWDRRMGPDDWWLTAELFDEHERPGFANFVRARAAGRIGAIFHDAIPLRWPHITWPQSVARHPLYMKRLAEFDRVWAVSEASRRDLTGFWRWQGVGARAEPRTVMLGADFDGAPRRGAMDARAEATDRPVLVGLGIVEPRKNQRFLLEVARSLWDEGLRFELHVVGRVNPHFGGPIRDALRRAARVYPCLHYHGAMDDAALARLLAGARAVVFPTIAEGCGLPLLEALWRGVPCVASDLAVLRENAEGGGCRLVAVNDAAAWRAALREVLVDEGVWRRLAAEAARRSLPRWRDTADALRKDLADAG